MKATTHVTFSGPLFDGRAEDALKRGGDAIRDHVSDEGVKPATAAFAESIRVNTGRFLGAMTKTSSTHTYTSSSGSKSYSMVITVDPVRETVVTNEIATYGPWLEGTGSRNETTRFKGYHGMRRAGQALNAVAGELADEAIQPYVREMNE